jgi:hypothetical protein
VLALLLLLTPAIAATARAAKVSSPSRTLAWSTYLGGGYDDEGMDITVDAAGNTYVSGSTMSTDFPGGAGMLGGWDAFVTKLDPQGKLVFTTFVGGSWYEWARGVAVDASGNIYLAGFTASTQDFPGAAPVPRPVRQGEAFIAKLDPTGSRVLWTTLLGGGSDDDEATDIALDAAGNVYVVGETASADFPWTHRLFPSAAGAAGSNLFIAKLSPDDGSVTWATGLGGNGHERARRIAVDSAGRAIFTAATESSDFPWVNAPPPASAVPLGVVAKLDPSGSSLVWSRNLGNEATGVAVDTAGNAWVTGTAFWTEVPLVNPLQSARSGWSDAFVTQLGTAGNVLFSTYLGGREGDGGTGIALGPAGHVWVTGDTSSPDFPLRNSLQAGCTDCELDAFLAEIDAVTPKLLFSTRFGGSVGVQGDFQQAPPDDAPASLAVDARGNASITGWTYSTDLPTVHAVQPRHAGSEDFGGTADAFVARIAPGGQKPPVCSAAAATPAMLWPANGRMTRIAVTGVTDPEGEPVTVSITRITQDEPRSGQAPDATGLGTSAPSVRASRAGNGDGRVYHLTFTAKDPQGAACTGRVTVCVPHDAKKRTCVDGGALVVSAGGG